MPLQYGEEIKKGQLLFVMSSTKFLTDYKSALMQYIKTKSDMNNSSTQLTEAKFLYKNELISKDDFKMKQSNFYTAQLAYLQAKDTLETLLRQLNIKNINLNTLSIADVDKVMQALRLPTTSENLPILSPAVGVILASSKNEGESKKITKGDIVKQGDVLAIIGNMEGLRVRIKVNELNVNQLKAGQKVKVTGIAFSDFELNGKIERIDRQGDVATNGLPTFLVEVIVPKLLAHQYKNIHVGMSAKVEVNIEEASQITIPLTAINEQNGIAYVKIFDRKSGKIRHSPIKTGKTTVNSVAVLSGLKEGESIVIPG
jgi:multidrug efflux pump subunit AcrA (membrane-fusion protein)